MRVQPKGYEASLQRMGEIMAKVRSIRPPEVQPLQSPAPISGAIGRGGSGSSGGFEPIDPFRDGATAVPSAAPHNLGPLIQSSAKQAGVDPALLESLVSAESSFNPKVVSNKGAIGLTQLMPGTARALGVQDPFDPAQNLGGGARYLAGLLKQFGGDERLALAAYNAGPGAVRRHGGVPPFKETQAYVERVLARARSIRGDR